MERGDSRKKDSYGRGKGKEEAVSYKPDCDISDSKVKVVRKEE